MAYLAQKLPVFDQQSLRIPMASSEKPVAKRVNVSLSEETIALLQGIARRRGVSMTEAVRIAIKTEDYIEQQIESGSKILIEKPDKTMCEVVFR
jgi:hypothetical protein